MTAPRYELIGLPAYGDAERDRKGGDADIDAIAPDSALDDALHGDRPLLVAGPPCSGKTTFALDALRRGIDAFGGETVRMAVSGRQNADLLADRIIRDTGPMAQARPVTTLSAIAFRLIAAIRSRLELPQPKLLNGAEQDALLRTVVDKHVGHVRAGEPCPTCALLREYFAVDDWSGVMTGDDGDAARGTADDPDAIGGGFARGVNTEFVKQLRDMLSRMNELGVSQTGETAALGALSAWSPRTERLHVQWRLAFALRREYAAAIGAAYPGEYRLDSSRLLAEGVNAVRDAEPSELPKLVVVDDCQDLTLAGFAFLEALHARDVRLVLTGNPDESVQTFRGSYPEYLFAQLHERMHATVLRIRRILPTGADPKPAHCETGAGTDGSRRGPVGRSFRDLVASRVSLSIASPQDEPLPLPQRPGKLPQLPGSLPITAVDDRGLVSDGSLATALYRSAGDEVEDVVWQIKTARLAEHRDWNDMAVIAHDNATVRRLGERLRRDGVPVRYSSVTRPLKDEPFVQGLFALLELARLRETTPDRLNMSLAAAAVYVRSRVVTLMNCPLISVGGGNDHEGHPAKLSVAEAAMGAFAALADVLPDRTEDSPEPDHTADTTDAGDAERSLNGLIRAWRAMRDTVLQARASDRVSTDDALVDAEAAAGDDLQFGIEALYLLLEFGDTDAVTAAVRAACGKDPHAAAFERLWSLVGTVAAGLRDLTSKEPQYALALAWDSCGVARRWQREALNNTDAGRAANDRLDTAMRLFDYASGSASAKDLTGFIAQVRGMRIEADSLAKTAPVDQAVTLTTPAGSAGAHWPLVWIPAMQQGVWPNLAARNTMFGGEDLADVMLTGTLADTEHAHGGDPRLASVLAGEQKSLLVALTRADERVTISAVANDDLSPSDFLYVYLPERFDRTTPQSRLPYMNVGQGDLYSGLDMTTRGLVAAARVALAVEPDGSPAGDDAIAALRLLAGSGVPEADPANWPFVADRISSAAAAGDGSPATHAHDDGAMTVTLSPSAVDGIWACPVCWLMENRFAGPRAGSTSTSFGSLIHEVARQASAAGLDLPDAYASQPAESRMERVRDDMMDLYRSLRTDPAVIARPEDRYDAARKDATAEAVFGRIASYFVSSNDAGYPVGNTANFTVGTLESAECERSFAALFDLADIAAAYNAMEDVDPVDPVELAAIMGTLVGGWPEAMSEGLTVRLTGRMDRMEHRIMPDGSRRVRLIDYKTGAVPSTQAVFNDLQLVCYQLGLAFPEGGQRGGEALRAMPRIAQSCLFHVSANAAPAQSYGQESLYQPALFHDGRLNDTPFTPRYFYKDPAKLADVPELPADPPQGVDARTWERFLALRGTQAVWALTMIARVFYAAAASRSEHLTVHPQAAHMRFCRMKAACPACAGRIDTIFETRQA
ncbi:PD-(D/E)XK nuclease family protein [Bifidobacterium amazonense]|uniref:PD-(D/E)XK nuclease family protein n=1 Tax=Bifidobacterium amazonense TaxID=2809027 RepID=A0ABS9VTM0_9BIFI|nr:PD-(D/E)XK nuclease family protein [Bifidobacterium amazonense]MCH9275291.1 PD-(D/E)XK nuclease family protein [Bifidobacterium amazonense]